MLSFTFLILVAIDDLVAINVTFNYCPKRGNNITQVNMTQCSAQPCALTKGTQVEIRILYQTSAVVTMGNYIKVVHFMRQNYPDNTATGNPCRTSAGALVVITVDVPTLLANMDNETMRVVIGNYGGPQNRITDYTCFLVGVNIV